MMLVSLKDIHYSQLHLFVIKLMKCQIAKICHYKDYTTNSFNQLSFHVTAAVNMSTFTVFFIFGNTFSVQIRRPCWC